MGKFSLCEVCLLFCVVMVKHSGAEPLYFLQSNSTTWDEARSQCQLCFKDLVTVIPNTTYVIGKNLSSNYWIGLRKYMSPHSNFTDSSDYNFSSNPGMAWSCWANGDPLAFQNWYPGWPKFKSNLPKISCCSCSCTCPAATDPVPTSVTAFDVTSEDILNTSYLNSTDMNTPNLNYPSVSSPFGSVSPAMPVASQCEKTPMLFPEFPDPDQDYIEDSCVAMLSNGAWVEKNCSDQLPFICYEDRFYGRASVSNVTASTAAVTWLPGPHDTSYYRLNVTYTNTTIYDELVPSKTPQPFNYTYQLQNLLAGSRYDVTVFAVKCQRDLYDPQEVSFYTIPNKVKNLTVTTQTPTSISLAWTEPDEDVDLYRLQYSNVQETIRATSTVVVGLVPGTQYNFTVWSGVNDTSKWSEPTSISAYTKPDKVSNLGVADRNSSSLTVNWTNPSGGFAGFNVSAVYVSNQIVPWSKTQTQNSSSITGLPSGTQVNVTVTVLGVDGQEGDPVQMSSYTAPDSIFNLSMIPASNSFNVTWNYSAPVYSPFSLLLQSSADKNYASNTTNLWFSFSSLKTATYYTVTVWSVVENTQSSGQSCSSFTLPVQPLNARVQSNSKNQLTFQWDPPPNIGTGNYSVELSSTFWRQNWNHTTNQTSYMFTNLTSGSNYAFEVRTLAGNLISNPTTTSAMTDSELLGISLAMECSSATPLLCANYSTKMEIFAKLNATIYKLLGLNVSWSLGNETFPNLAP